MIQVLKVIVQIVLALPEILRTVSEIIAYFKQKEIEKKIQKAMDADKKNNNTSSIEDIINK